MTAIAVTRPSPHRLPGPGSLVRILCGRRATIAVVVGSTVLVTVIAWGNRGFHFDDPGIFWRYASHLATGAGWDYNVGQAGTANAITSPLYVLLLALGRIIAGPGSLPAITSVFFVVFLAGTAAATFAGLRVVGHPAAGVIAAILVCTSPLLFILRGMESPLYLFLVSLTLLLFVTDHHWMSGVALGALILARPDGALLAISLGVYVIVRNRRLPLALTAGAVAIVLPWLVYAQIRFGQIYPGTLRAKMAQGRSGLWGYDFLHGLFFIPVIHAPGWSALLALPLAAGLVALVRKRELDPWIVPLLAGTAAYVVGYTLLGIPAYVWYYALPVFTATVVAALGIEWLLTSRRAVAALVGCLIAAEITVVGFREIPTGLSAPRNAYETVGLWLEHHTPPGASVASDEIGLIGYYSHRPIVDYLGLLSATEARAVARGDLVSWVGRYQPDYVVVVDSTVADGVEPFAKQVWFPSVFRPVYRVENVVVFKRTGRAP